MRHRLPLLALSLFSGCTFARHSLYIPGLGWFERTDLFLFDQQKAAVSTYSYTLDPNWPIAVAALSVGLVSATYIWWRRRSIVTAEISPVD